MSLFPTLLLAGTQATQQISAGIAANNEAKYNAGLYEQKAGIIDMQKSLEAGQYNRAKGQLAGKSIARTAKAGFEMSGSPMAVMIDSLTQLELDKAIGQYNLETQKRYAQATADEYKRRGRASMTAAYSNAFSTILRGGFDYATSSGLFSGNNYANVGGQRVLVAPPDYYKTATPKF